MEWGPYRAFGPIWAILMALGPVEPKRGLSDTFPTLNYFFPKRPCPGVNGITVTKT